MKYPVLGRVSNTWRSATVLGALFLLASAGVAAEAPVISGVSVSRPFFNPFLGQKVGVSFNLTTPGKLTILILDPDGFLVRRLVSDRSVEKGKLSFDWDGRDELGEVVPDEAYSLKIDLQTEDRSESYFPANSTPERFALESVSHDPSRGVISYQLPAASRVSVLAFVVATAATSNSQRQPETRTIVDREPRVAGSVVEQWNGFDRTGKTNLSGHGEVKIQVDAVALPENALITVGNRQQTFRDRLAKRRGASLLTKRES